MNLASIKTSKCIFTTEFKLEEKIYSPKLELSKHEHEHDYFCFVIKGNFTENYNKHSRSYQKSTLVFHPANEKHSDHFHTLTSCFDIQINVGWLNRLRQRSKKIIDYSASFGDGRIIQLSKRLHREFWQQDDFSGLSIEGLILEMLAETSRDIYRKTENKPPPWLKKVREIVHDEFRQRPSLVTLAESVNIHPVHLAREFHRFYSCTIGDYILQRRIEYACVQISESEDSISDIALSAGFFDQSHFTRTFKARVGMTPIRYRQTFRGR